MNRIGIRRRPLFAAAFACLALVSAGAERAAAADDALRTRNVVILAIDGVRSSEAFKNQHASRPGRPPYSHPLIPRVWSQLIPNGTTYLDAKNIETTYTTPGFNAILSGNWQMGPNRSRQDLNAYFENRSRQPLLSEIYRKVTGREALTVVGKRNSLTNDFSLHPGYGLPFGPRFLFLDSGRRLDDPFYDNRTYQLAIEEMNRSHPSLVFVNLGATDLAAHQEDYPFYVSLIQNWDELVVNFWNYIQSDPIYRNTTTLILTTDHGRHTEETIDYVSHGGQCEGCRDVMLFVIGPDTPANLRVNRRVRHTDIAPTVAELLCLPLPITDGEPLAEAIGRPYVPADRGVRDVSTASKGGLVFTATAERLGSTTAVFVRGSRDGGQSFGDSVPLADFGGARYDDTAKQPRLAIVGDRLHAVWIDLADPNGLWTLRHRSADLAPFAAGGDLVFGPAMVLETSILEGQRSDNEDYNAGIMLNRPAITALHPAGTYKVAAAFAMNRAFVGFRLSATDFQNDDPMVKKRSMLPFKRYFPEEPALAAGGPDELFVAWIDMNVGISADINGDGLDEDVHPWNLMFTRSVDGGVTWSDPPVVLTSGLGSVFTPRVAFNGSTGQIHVVFSAPDAAGRYQVMTAVGQIERRWSRTDCGVDFTEVIPLTSSSTGAWEPTIGVDSGGGLHVAYVDFDYPEGDVLLGYSKDGKSLSGPSLNLSGSALVSTGPSIELSDGPAGVTSRFVAWREEDPATRTLRVSRVVLPFTRPAR